MLNETIILIIAYFGVFIGKYLYVVAEEEVKVGKRNLVIFQNIMFIFALVWFLFLMRENLLLAIPIVLGLLILGDMLKNFYVILGFLLGIDFNFVLSVLIFICGLPTGSLMMNKDATHVFRKTWLFLLFGLLGLIASKFLF